MHDARLEAKAVAGGIALGSLLLLAVAVDSAAAPTAADRLVDQATPSAEPSGTISPTPDPSPTPEGAPGGTDPCRVVSEPLAVLDESGRTWAWTTLQNTGSATVTLSALQTGWSDTGTLAEVVVERGGRRDSLHGGSVSSPASVVLRSEAAVDPRSLAPGAVARLGLRFDGVSPGSLAVGPTVVHLREGCAVALHAPTDAPCPLTLTEIRKSGNDPSRVVMSARNGGATALDIAVAEVYWPAEVNGPLRWLVIGGRDRIEIADAESSPAAVRLDRLLGGPLRLGPGSSTSIWLEFAEEAAERPYVVTLAAVDGCSATSTTWLDAHGCGVRTNDFETFGLRARLRLTNTLPAPRSPTSLDLFWPTGINGALVRVQVNGQPVWSGRERRSPASVRFDAAPPIGPYESATIDLVFAPDDEGPSAPSSGEVIAGQDYTLVLGIGGGCRLVFTTLRGVAPGCSVTAGSLAPVDGAPEVEVPLTNTGGRARLRRAVISWPARNGNLTSVRLGAESLFTGDEPPSGEPLSVLTAPGSAFLEQGSTLPLGLSFSGSASRTGYALSLSFVDSDGAACADLVVTPPMDGSGCALSIDEVDPESERLVDAYVTNRGNDEVELSFVNVDWPVEEGRNQLVRVLLVDGDSEYVLWTGNIRVSPARVPLAGTRATVVEPDETVRLRLQYGELLNVPDPATQMRLAVGTVEGCQAFFPDDDRETRPERESFNGLLLALPDDGPWGWWTIELQRGAVRDVRPVLVRSNTLLEPSSVRPAVGDLLRVEALLYDDGWHAERIAFRSGDQRIQLVGRIADVDRWGAVGSRPAWIRLQSYGPRVWIVSDTRIEGRLDVGATVTIVGTVDPTGSVSAIEIIVQSAAAGEAVTVRGVVQGARLAPEIGPTWQVWTLDKYYVELDASDPDTRLEDPPGRLARPGERFEVRGTLTDQTIDASSVSPLAQPNTTNVDGVLVTVPAGGVVGSWTVRRGGGDEITFAVESTANVDTRSAPAISGVRVRALLEDAGNGRWTALSVRTDWPD